SSVPSPAAVVMRILLLNPIGAIGGGERVLLDLLAGLRALRPEIELHLRLLEDGPLAGAARAAGAEVAVLSGGETFRAMGDSALRSNVVVAGGGRRGRARIRSAVALAMRGLIAGPGVWRLVKHLRRETDRVRPDVVHSNGIKTHLLSGLARPREARL